MDRAQAAEIVQRIAAEERQAEAQARANAEAMEALLAPAPQAPAPTPVPTSATPTTPPAGAKLRYGANIQDAPWTAAPLDAFIQLVGKTPASAGWSMRWDTATHTPQLAAEMARRCLAKGIVPLIAWEPYGAHPRDIAAGAKDAYIRQWASALAQVVGEVRIRFAHEFNGDGGWYPWQIGTNGVTPEHLRDAHRRVAALFREAGATNVRWVWCVNIRQQLDKLAAAWPGRDNVHYVGMDGYCWGPYPGRGGWQPFQQVFQGTYDKLVALAPGVPIIVCETACPEEGAPAGSGGKPQWIRDIPKAVSTSMPAVVEVDWFHHAYDKYPAETPGGLGGKFVSWKVDSSTTAKDAYRAVVAA